MYPHAQVVIGIVILFKSRYNINEADHHKSAEALNNITVWLIFAVTVINVFVSAFGIDNNPSSLIKSLIERDPEFYNQTLKLLSAPNVKP